MFANSKKVTTFAPAIEREILDKKDGPFVYRLGRKIFILERGVRLSYGLRTRRAAERHGTGGGLPTGNRNRKNGRPLRVNTFQGAGFRPIRTQPRLEPI